MELVTPNVKLSSRPAPVYRFGAVVPKLQTVRI